MATRRTPAAAAPDAQPGQPGQRIYFVSLGCPKNQVDTELMLGQVQAAGHALVDSPDGADVIVVNTCAFIDAAKEESVDTILEMATYKKAARGKLVVTGCLAQRYAGELAKDIPEIDHILGSADFQSIAKALEPAPVGKLPSGKAKRKALPVIQVSETPAYIYDHDAPRVRIGARHSAYVKVAEGCDRPCSFCIIPKLRGPQRSRTIDDIVAEARGLAREGVLEVNLIAQDLTRYGWDQGTTPEARQTLAQLLRGLGKVDALEWIRLHYTFPSAFDDELIDAIASEPKVVKYIDVPLQHISDPMLKRMRRGHSSRVTRELVKKLRARIDDVVIRTTFIVGHPGETAEEFDELCAFVEESRFDRAGAFTYSIEPGTTSAMLPNRVDPDVMAERQQTLMEIQRKISRARHEAMVGKEITVLVEGVSSESEYLLEGRWYGQAPGIDGVTYLADGQVPAGSLVRARVTQASDYDLAATLEL
ncbi:MAG: 30S ribosomal protein S12 methylthiotransferase RimO [Deltaproteobacteria bacterium]|nr:30S ribosomal protein S12 methylthiotransferase RimO [Deltaproteobacteria bacterium]MDQ3300263.1 30S ribosomal protein S12 methylthiotransferase RimO [Myxococcota bacterium]